MRTLARIAALVAGCALTSCISARYPTPAPVGLDGLANDAAALVLVYPGARWWRIPVVSPGSGPPIARAVVVRSWIDVIDGGEVIARVEPGSWTALPRSPGHHRLLAVAMDENGGVPAPRLVGVMDAELRRGLYYYVDIEPHQPDPCVRGRPQAPTLDLRGVPTTGPRFTAVRDTLAFGPSLAPAPRGLAYPSAAALRERASERLTMECSPPIEPVLETLGRAAPIETR